MSSLWERYDLEWSFFLQANGVHNWSSGWIGTCLNGSRVEFYPFDQPIADRWGLLRAEAQMKGRPLSVVDGLLAATAVQHSLTIVSRNVSDFAAVGLAVFNPWEDRV